MVNPVEAIQKARRRLTHLAAMRTGLFAALPLAVTVSAVLGLDVVGSMILEEWGYIFDPRRELVLLEMIGVFLGAQMVALAYCTWRAWRRADDFLTTAERIDDLIGSHQEVLTLATLADPSRPELRLARSPLFPALWRRAIAYLEPFDPQREFRLDYADPLKRSSLLAAATATILGLAMVASMHMPTPLELASHRLRQLAGSLDKPSATPEERQLAAAARDVARDLDQPKLPPQQKLAELEALKKQLEHLSKGNQQRTGDSGGGSGSGNGNGEGTGSGQGNGKGSGGGTGTGQGGGSTSKGKKSDQQMIELRNDIAKAQMKLEEESKSNDKSQTAKNNDQNGSGLASQAGDNPKQAGPQNKPNGTGNIEVPQPNKLAQSRMPSAGTPSGSKNDKGSQGDTHLGEFPKAVNYERFYKLGEKGPPLDIRDARYVTFRLPTEVVAGAAGRMVADSTRPTATASYTNAPLKEQRVAISPDEQQLVPPRYRDLIH